MDKDIQDIKRRAGLLEDVVDFQRGKQPDLDAQQSQRGEDMRNLIAGAVKNLQNAYVTWVKANWEKDGRPMPFNQYLAREAKSEGEGWFEERIEEFNEELRDAISFFLSRLG